MSDKGKELSELRQEVSELRQEVAALRREVGADLLLTKVLKASEKAARVGASPFRMTAL